MGLITLILIGVAIAIGLDLIYSILYVIIDTYMSNKKKTNCEVISFEEYVRRRNKNND